MNQPNFSRTRISAAGIALAVTVLIALGLIAAGAYMDSQGKSSIAWLIEPTATLPRTYPCSPLTDGSYLPARVQLQYEEQCRQQPQ